MSTLREDFEDWVASEGRTAERWGVANRQYKNRIVHEQWLAYQAATERAARVCENLSALSDKPVHDNDDCAAAIRGTGSGA